MKAAATILIFLALAGCTKDGSAVADIEPADVSTGMLHGIVLDTTVTPVAGVNISIDGYAVWTLTNSDGEFAFDGFTEGTYFVNAIHPDYKPRKVEAVVVAGIEPDMTQITIQPRQTVEPFIDPFVFDGFIQCSYRIVVTADNCPGGDSEVTYELSVIPDWTQSELSWGSGSALGDELSFQYTVPGTAVDYIETEGPSPLAIWADEEDIKNHGIGDGLDLYLRVFTADVPATEVPGYWGVGLQFDQEFTTYTHVFYDMQPEPGWRFVE